MDSIAMPEPDFFDQYFQTSDKPFTFYEDSELEMFLPTQPYEQPEQMVKQEEESAPATTHETSEVGLPEPLVESHSRQSKLHNCPKHLVKFLAQALDLVHLDKLDFDKVFGHMTSGGLSAIKGLLEILLFSHKGKIKSTSKELLKIVFESGSEKNRKFKLLNNQKIRTFFENHDPMSVMEAKACLRDYAIEKLLLKKNSCIDESRIIHKEINERYVEIFIKELQEGLIKQRISKTDKLRIFEACVNF